jgi:hypothetical protein
MRLVLPLCVLALLCACGDATRPPASPPVTTETWFFAPDELARLILENDEGALAWIPAGVLEKTDVSDGRQLRLLTELLVKTVIPRLTVLSDGSFVLDLKAEEPGGGWRTVKASGTWAAEGEQIVLTITKRTSLNLAPLEIADTLTLTRRGAFLYLEALGRRIPLKKRAL